MSELVRREPDPVEGRIPAPGTVYRGVMAPWEAPGEAIPVYCPIGEGCEWWECWDDPQEVREAVLGHVRTVHDAEDPIGAMKDAWWREQTARFRAKDERWRGSW